VIVNMQPVIHIVLASALKMSFKEKLLKYLFLVRTDVNMTDPVSTGSRIKIQYPSIPLMQ
jgi:hypothetical protein